MERIGIMGGTFDPIHKGHIEFAKFAAEAFDLNKILLIPTGNPPHKITHLVTSPRQRLEMAGIAAAPYDFFEVKDYEVRRTGETFTYDTLKEVKADYPDAEIFYLIGSDTLLTLDKWHNKDEVFGMCKFICAVRKEDMGKNLENAREELAKSGAEIQMTDFDTEKISSTELRNIMAEGGDFTRYVPEKVAEYIKKEQLYKKKHLPLTDEEIQMDLKEILKPQRYTHSLGVMEEAVRIGKILGADLAKCKTAGLLHDCGKNLSKEQLDWLGFGGEHTKEEYYNGFNVRLLHAKTGKIIAKERYGITDGEILEAIGNHITGTPEMGLLSCIVFLADYTEKGRVGEEFDEARRLITEKGLYHAMLYECENTIKYVMQKGEPLDINTIKTRNWLISLTK